MFEHVFEHLFEQWLLPIFRVSTPLILAALGGMWCERSGVIQIGLEGFILLGSFFGAVAALHFTDPYIGFLVAGLSGMLLAMFYGVMVLHLRSNQIIAATATNLLALGVPPFFSKIWYDSTGSTPPIPTEGRFTFEPLVFTLMIVLVSYALFYYTRFGLRLRFAGEHPKALSSAGVSVLIKRWQGVMISGLLAGFAGGTLSIYLSSSYTRNMSAGRGFIALAAVVLGKWKPIPVTLACLFFGLTETMQIRLQGVVLWGENPVPVQWIQILPYLVTLIVLAGFVGMSFAPTALGTPWKDHS